MKYHGHFYTVLIVQFLIFNLVHGDGDNSTVAVDESAVDSGNQTVTENLEADNGTTTDVEVVDPYANLPVTDGKVNLTKEEWKKRLTPEQYQIAREAGTEQSFSGKYYKTKDNGTYICVCCGNEVFSSSAKFDSGSGWPSFFQPVVNDSIEIIPDNSHGMEREEVRCSRCAAHLGHRFDDGPKPTGQRYCINSASLNLVKNK